MYRGLDTRTGEHVAIKQLSLERIATDALQVLKSTLQQLHLGGVVWWVDWWVG